MYSMTHLDLVVISGTVSMLQLYPDGRYLIPAKVTVHSEEPLILETGAVALEMVLSPIHVWV